MIKQLFILATLISISLTACSQQKLTTFEKELNDLRYSLYESLDTVPFEQLRNMDFYSFVAIQNKVEDFIKKHEKEIYEYKLNTLNLYKDIPLPDLKGYKLFYNDGEITEISSFMKESLKQLKHVYDLYSLDLNHFINFWTSIHYSRLGNIELASEGIMNTIAAPRISTRKKDKDTWTVFSDKYKYIFEFTYSFKDNFLSLVNVYEKE